MLLGSYCMCTRGPVWQDHMGAIFVDSEEKYVCKSPFMTSMEYFKLCTSSPRHHWPCWKRDLLGSIKHQPWFNLVCFLVRSLCVSWRNKKLQRRACIDSHKLSTTFASPCQTLAGTTSKRILIGSAHQLAVPRICSSPRVCFSFIYGLVHETL